MKKVILPKRLAHPHSTPHPLFFLAGPVRGGGDWQWRCTLELERQLGEQDFSVAIPYHDLPNRQPSHPAMISLAEPAAGGDAYFERQLNWEHHYLSMAAAGGCLVIWLQCQDMSDPRPEGSGPYAQDTYGELGEWRSELGHNPKLRVVVGAQNDFHGLSQIQRNFSRRVGYDFPIYSTLRETVAAAIKKTGIQAM
jgi:hypothetical protein